MTTPLLDEPPSPPGAPAPASALASMGLALCAASRQINAWSLAVLLITFIAGGLGLNVWATGLLVLSLVLAGCQACWAWRLAFDQPVFAAWARLPDDECPAALRAFDIALGALLKKDVAAGQTRSMSSRVMGVRRLHRLQIAAVLAQVLALLALMAVLSRAHGHA